MPYLAPVIIEVQGDSKPWQRVLAEVKAELADLAKDKTDVPIGGDSKPLQSDIAADKIALADLARSVTTPIIGDDSKPLISGIAADTVALAALGWLEDVTSMIEPPAPEREPLTFCAKYCPFFGELCSGIPKDLSGDPIMDDAATDAARRYKELAVELKELEKEKDALKATLEGHAGITLDGIKVLWSEIAGRQTPDLPEIEKLLGGSSPIPMKTGSPSLRLEVR